MSRAVRRAEESALRRTFVQVCQEVESWPLPGQGSTDRRLELLASCSATDLVLGRLVEAHADALAILYELGAPVERHPGSGVERRWGVWAAGSPQGVVATRRVDEWRISGTKNWCSGAGLVTHALLDAVTGDGQRLFEVDLSNPGVTWAQQDWTGPGMSRADTRRVEFLNVAARAIGEPGQYLSRPGFWAGAIGVAACWHGGTVAVAEALRGSVDGQSDTHALVHLGAVYTALLQNWSTLRGAGQTIDLKPTADFAVLARAVRHSVERNAAMVLDRVGRALGPRPLAYDKGHAEAVHDLEIYIRQEHAERDLECLGHDLVDRKATWPI
jgi:alkylation response protein AidB-like acyl-CoA dehydrogenase